MFLQAVSLSYYSTNTVSALKIPCYTLPTNSVKLTSTEPIATRDQRILTRKGRIAVGGVIFHRGVNSM